MSAPLLARVEAARRAAAAADTPETWARHARAVLDDLPALLLVAALAEASLGRPSTRRDSGVKSHPSNENA